MGREAYQGGNKARETLDGGTESWGASLATSLNIDKKPMKT
jgi:hypothetical protein